MKMKICRLAGLISLALCACSAEKQENIQTGSMENPAEGFGTGLRMIADTFSWKLE